MEAELQTRGVIADRMPEVQKALRFVESDPMVDAVGETVHNDFDVVGKPFWTFRIQPATAQEKLIRIVPMKKRDPGFDLLRQEFID